MDQRSDVAGYQSPLSQRLLEPLRRSVELRHLYVGAAQLDERVSVADGGDEEAMLLGQALNHIAGSDNLGLRAHVLRDLLESLPQQEILDLLPETSRSLQELTNLGEQSIAQALRQWEQMQKARLRHLAFQLTDAQLVVVVEALEHLNPLTELHPGNPNRRGTALYLLCQWYLAWDHREIGIIPQEERP